MKIRKRVDGEIREYSVMDSRCKRAKCFIPFSGNGQDICRGYELGKCPTIESIDESFGECDNCGPVTLCWDREVRTIHTETGTPCAFGGGKGFHDGES